ncbi:MAG: ABC-transporter integral membrane component [Candidatus Moranbacteria bacterium GW2011_GWE1_36_7]|nr:MAG: ABC-transporter integral membrane component [Candidatus Moranbacteria bacterium GW2011_GWD2_36_12]KKQ05802.1 MAG: ABC-transporter integral membrane component [Candidatus Moranbacteria bacterium GW2011_GWE2_36_40]KKQ12375.1 MAG: ABC-transporter integral membrane component [Candidatus Moranbacteria bacterium GW2011_GWE1_36_7]
MVNLRPLKYLAFIGLFFIFIMSLNTEKEIIVYQPNSRQKTGFLKSLFLMAKNIKNSRELIWQLFVRDFLAAYKKSFLGIGWIILAPIFGIVSWVFMNYAGVLKPGDVGIPYPAYILLGTSFWGLFMGFYTSAAETLNTGQGFIMQVKYPHEALLAKQILQQLANFLASFIVIMLVLLSFKVIPSWQILILPILILPMLFLGAGIGLLVSVIGVVANEIRRIMDIALGTLIFFTPIIYSSDSTGGMIAKIIKINPLTYIIGGVRDAITYGKIENLSYFIWSGIGSFIFFLFAWRLFYVSEEKVIEKMI